MKTTALKVICTTLLATAAMVPGLASAEVYLNGAPYMAMSAPDDFIMQGGWSEYGDAFTVRNSIRTRAQQYCTYRDRQSRLAGYEVSRGYGGSRFNMIDFGWTVRPVPYDLVRPFHDQGLAGYARGFDYIRCR